MPHRCMSCGMCFFMANTTLKHVFFVGKRTSLAANKISMLMIRFRVKEDNAIEGIYL